MSGGPSPRQRGEGDTVVVSSFSASSRKPYVEVHNGSHHRRAISATAIGAVLASLVTILLAIATCLYPAIRATSVRAPQRRLASGNWWEGDPLSPSSLLCDEVLTSGDESSDEFPPAQAQSGSTPPRKRAYEGGATDKTECSHTGGAGSEGSKRFRPIDLDSTPSPQGSPVTESGQNSTPPSPEGPLMLFLEESLSGDEDHNGTQQPSPQPPKTVDNSVNTGADQTQGGADCAEDSDGSGESSSTQGRGPQSPETVDNSVGTGADQTHGAGCAKDSEASGKDGPGSGGGMSPQEEMSTPSPSPVVVEGTVHAGDSAKSHNGESSKHQSEG